jgi:hypothetical protein
MSLIKAPGPNGFSVNFYQKHWAIIGLEVSNVVIDSLNSCYLNKEVNYTYIALIPNVKNPSSVTDYCPISLCIVLYKIISKVLANWLKLELPIIISYN